METNNSSTNLKEQLGEVVFKAGEVFLDGITTLKGATNKDMVNALAMLDRAVIKFAADNDEDIETGMQALLYVLNNKEYL